MDSSSAGPDEGEGRPQRADGGEVVDRAVTEPLRKDLADRVRVLLTICDRSGLEFEAYLLGMVLHQLLSDESGPGTPANRAAA